MFGLLVYIKTPVIGRRPCPIAWTSVCLFDFIFGEYEIDVAVDKMKKVTDCFCVISCPVAYTVVGGYLLAAHSIYLPAVEELQ